jgi:hypothetical protein
MTERDDYFSIKGRHRHINILFILTIWVGFCLPVLFEFGWHGFVCFTSALLPLAAIMVFSYSFEIRVDKSFVLLKYKFWFIPYYTIKSKTQDLIINDGTIGDIKLISPRKDYYRDDIKNNLRFSYIMPWDGDEFIFFIDYKNKELYFDIACDEFAWKSVIQGLRNLDKR